MLRCQHPFQYSGGDIPEDVQEDIQDWRERGDYVFVWRQNYDVDQAGSTSEELRLIRIHFKGNRSQGAFVKYRGISSALTGKKLGKSVVGL